MKTRIKNLFFLYVLIICFCLNRAETARAQSGNYNGFGWQKSGNGATITGYTGPSGAIIVPGAIPYAGTNLPVTSIGYEAFASSQSQVTSVTIPDSVTDIASYAFLFCLSLTNVVLGNGVINIESNAFADCNKLISVNIPNGVTSIGDQAFYLCGRVSSINIPGSVTNIGGLAFDGCGATNVITIGSGLISIGFAALNDCFRLSGFAVDPENPFYSSLGGVLFDKNQTTLIAFPGGVGGSYAIPSTVTEIGPGGFSNATNLTNVIIPNSVINIDTNAFFSCYGLTSITIPDSVTNIEFQAFSACWYLASVNIGSNVISIGPRAFQYCADLQSIYFRGNAPVADSTAFSGPTNLIAYYLPGTTDWSVFAANTGVPVALWLPQIQTGTSGFGVQTDQFGFNINWTSDQTVTIEACTDLFSADWQPLQTNTFAASSLYFNDTQSTNHSTRYYRIVSP